MKLAIIVLAMVGAAMACGPGRAADEFEAFRKTYRKQYRSEEEYNYRCAVFTENLAKIEAHNIQHQAGLNDYELKINTFADLTFDEFVSTHTGFVPNEAGSLSRGPTNVYKYDSNYKCPDEIDWRTKGFAPQIRDQGRCGSCWAFATASVTEAQYAIKYNDKSNWQDYSEQHLVECVAKCGKCNGCNMVTAYDHLISTNQATVYETSYPYTSWDGNNGTECKYNSPNTIQAHRIYGYTDIEKSDKALKQAICRFGPIAVGMKVQDDFQLSGGTADKPYCPKTALGKSGCSTGFLGIGLNHAVVIVGYTKNAWIVQNSWSRNWGDAGYAYICTDFENMCGVNQIASFPLVA